MKRKKNNIERKYYGMFDLNNIHLLKGYLFNFNLFALMYTIHLFNHMVRM